MSRVKIRYLVAKSGRAGTRRFYWQPSGRLTSQGYRTVRLPDDEAQAIAAALRLNADLDDRHRAPLTRFDIRTKCNERAGLYVIGNVHGPIKLGFSKAP